jgi:bifunctional UDP-N-acetylglucosamine pyrophosphorylase/glucosamine-1-phosphate N-acetyltransferase
VLVYGESMSAKGSSGQSKADIGEIAVVVLAAGKGTRMRSALPKVMHPLAGRPMLCQVVETAAQLAPKRAVVVVGADMDGIAELVAPWPTVVQEPQMGTGHAVLQARAALDGFTGDVLVLCGDTPLIRVETLRALIAARRGPGRPAVAVLGFRPADPGPYGRLEMAADGTLARIVEAADADAKALANGLCNSGVTAADAALLFDLLDRLGTDNAKGEVYLTDVVAAARAAGRTAVVLEADADELRGVNTRAELAAAEAVIQERLRRRAMDAGASLTDPASVWLSHDTRLGRDVRVGPNVVFGPGVTVGDEVEILPFCHLEGAAVARGARIGPFARLRPGTEVGEGARVGNFVEVKAARIEAGAKVSHLSYVGDARVGAGANVGAGTITCNYDGVTKSRTEIGAGAFIGSNTALVAPVTIGDGAVIGAGSTITGDVEADALAVARGEQRSVPGGARRYRARRAKSKRAG